ncbi:LuxR C-terminal-related transcriptional regulator [Kitasatospora gansuensis]
MPDLPMPGEAEHALYAEVLAQGGKVLFRDVAHQDAAIVLRLLELGLLIHHTGDATLTAVNPRTVAEGLAADLRSAGTRMLLRAEEIPAPLEELARAYDAAPRKVERVGGVLHIQDMEEIRSRMLQLEADCQDECLAAQPGGARPVEHLEGGVERLHRLLARGATLRVLYEEAARSDEPTARHAATVTGWGARVRILHEPFTRMLIFDRATAVIPASADRTRAAVVEDPAVVSFLVSGFERDWERAERVRWQAVGDQVHEQVGRLLTQGLTQKMIASRLGLSERTVAYHIARLRELHDAETLFQLGWQMRGARAGG